MNRRRITEKLVQLQRTLCKECLITNYEECMCCSNYTLINEILEELNGNGK